MAVNMQEGNMPHIYWIDLKSDGVFTECAVMKKDGFGNVYFFPLKSLDSIDKKRLARILTNRNANNFELWDLMGNITLNNGVNALEYFHQLVEMVTPGGRVMKPQEGVIGVEGTGGVIDTRSADSRAHLEAAAKAAADAAASAAGTAAAAAYTAAQQATSRPATETAPPPAAKKKTASKKKASKSE